MSKTAPIHADKNSAFVDTFQCLNGPSGAAGHIEAVIVFLAIRGLISVTVAEWIIHRGGLCHA